MDPQSPPFTIAIIGGGLGGLALAIALLHQSIPVQIYEAASCFSEIGAGVAFGPNTLRAIAAIDPALNAAYERCATRNAWSEKRRKWMAFRLGCDVFGVEGRAEGRVGDLICEDEAGEVGQCSVHRAKFLGEMVNLIPEGVAHFGKTVVGVQEVGEGHRRRVRLTFSDGESAEASVAVGCDGIKSRVRRILLGEDNPLSRPQFVGEYAFRGLIPMEKAREVLGEYTAGNGHIHIGYGGYVVTYPTDGHKFMNMVAVRAKADGKWEHEQWVVESTREGMLKSFEGWNPRIIALLHCVEKTDMWGLFDHGRAPKYYKGRVCMMGDAAHASTPHQGQGAGMAFEDAYILSQLIGHARTADDLEGSFRAFDAVRRPRTQRMVETSREAGRIFAFREAGIWDDIEKVRRATRGRQNWLWFEDLEREIKEGKAIMRCMRRRTDWKCNL